MSSFVSLGESDPLLDFLYLSAKFSGVLSPSTYLEVIIPVNGDPSDSKISFDSDEKNNVKKVLSALSSLSSAESQNFLLDVLKTNFVDSLGKIFSLSPFPFDDFSLFHNLFLSNFIRIAEKRDKESTFQSSKAGGFVQVYVGEINKIHQKLHSSLPSSSSPPASFFSISKVLIDSVVDVVNALQNHLSLNISLPQPPTRLTLNSQNCEFLSSFLFTAARCFAKDIQVAVASNKGKSSNLPSSSSHVNISLLFVRQTENILSHWISHFSLSTLCQLEFYEIAVGIIFSVANIQDFASQNSAVLDEFLYKFLNIYNAQKEGEKSEKKDEKGNGNGKTEEMAKKVSISSAIRSIQAPISLHSSSSLSPVLSSSSSSPSSYHLSPSRLLTFISIKSLATGDSNDKKLYQLLVILAGDSVSEYLTFEKNNSDFFAQNSLKQSEMLRKVRILSFTQLAAKEIESQTPPCKIKYETIAKQLQLTVDTKNPLEDLNALVELSVIDCFQSGRIDCRMDQNSQIVTVKRVVSTGLKINSVSPPSSSSSPAVVDATADWISLSRKLSHWKHNVTAVVQNVHKYQNPPVNVGGNTQNQNANQNQNNNSAQNHHHNHYHNNNRHHYNNNNNYFQNQNNNNNKYQSVGGVDDGVDDL